MKRRNFLKGLFGSALAYGISGSFSSRLLLAETPCSGDPRHFVVINLDGGADGYFKFPFMDAARKAVMDARRGEVAVDYDEMIDLGNGEVALHEALSALYAAHVGGDMKLISSVGFPNQSLSHYKAQKCHRILTCGPGGAQGWIGRLKDLYPELGLFDTWSLNAGNALDLKSTSARPSMVAKRLSDFYYEDGPLSPLEAQKVRAATQTLFQLEVERSELGTQLQDTQKLVEPARVRVQEILTQGLSGSYGSSGEAEMLKDTVRIIKDKAARGDSCSSIYLLKQGGYDSHSNQVGSIVPRLQRISEAVRGARTDLINAGLWDKTVILLNTEFGRTLNKTDEGLGTDHGRANTLMMVGGSINGGTANLITGDLPSSAQLGNPDVNYLEPSVDPRNIYAEVFNFLGFDANLIFEGEDYVRRSLGIFA